MSGSEIVLRADAGGALTRCLLVADRIPRRTELPFVLIGGVAVVVRLGRFHRATADVDTLAVAGLKDATLEMLGPVVAEATARNSVSIDSVAVDFVPLDEPTPSTGTPVERAWCEGRPYVFRTATEHTVTLVDTGDNTISSQRLRIATPGGLVFLKTIAIERRLGARVVKRTSDMHDVVRLVGAHPLAQLGDQLASAPERDWLAARLEQIFRSDARYTIQRIALGNPDAALLGPDDLERVAELADVLRAM